MNYKTAFIRTGGGQRADALCSNFSARRNRAEDIYYDTRSLVVQDICFDDLFRYSCEQSIESNNRLTVISFVNIINT